MMAMQSLDDIVVEEPPQKKDDKLPILSSDAEHLDTQHMGTLEGIRRKRIISIVIVMVFIVAVIILTAALVVVFGKVGAPSITFVVIGDWGRRGQQDQKTVANAMAEYCETRSCSFVVSTGDNFYTTGVISTQDPHWNQSFESVYSAPSLQIPWYIVLGNHDYLGNVSAQLDYAKLDSRWNLPGRYYTHDFVVGDTFELRLVMTDTSALKASYRHEERYNVTEIVQQNVTAQLEWLDQQLVANDTRWTMVFGHHNIYSTASDHQDDDDMIATLQPLLTKHQVPMYICGHSHSLQHIQLVGDPTAYFVSGSGGMAVPQQPELGTRKYSSWYAGIPGFMAVTVDAVQATVEAISFTGQRLNSFSVHRPTHSI